MAFTKKIPEWNASGVEPPQSLKDSGWKPGVKPAADHFNWLQTTASEAIKELQQKAGEVKKVNGQLPDANGNVNVNIDTSKLATKEELSSASTYIQQEMNDLEQTVAAHQTDLESQENGKGASLIGINDSGNKFTATTVEGALSELFQFANDGKTNIATVVGSPTLSSDTFSKISSDIQTQKNNMATNLSNKGQPSVGTETLKALVDKVANVNTGKKWASGTLTSFYHEALSYWRADVTGLSFKPSVVVACDNNGFSFYMNGMAFYGSYNSGNKATKTSVNATGFILQFNAVYTNMTWMAFE